MNYVISHFAWWLAGALAIGAVTGIGTWARKPRGSWLSSWISWAAALFVVGCLAAVFKLVAGRGGLWLETALAMFAVYIAGCVIGGWLRALFAAPEPLLTPIAARVNAAKAALAPVFAFPAPPANAPLAITSSQAYPGKRPAGLAAPDGAPDDLTAIGGIEPVDRKILGDLGIHHFRQIAAWTPDNEKWINHHLTMPGRVEREGWIGSAQALAKGAAQSSAVPARNDTIVYPRGSVQGTAPARATIDPAVVATLAGASPFSVGSPAATSTAAAFDMHGAHSGTRPPRATPSQQAAGDDLRRIRGVSPHNVAQLNRAGIFSYDQIARFGADECTWIDNFMGAPGRCERDNWVEQARLLATAKHIEATVSSPVHLAAVAAIAPVAVGNQSGASNGHTPLSSAPALAGDVNAPHPGVRPAALPQPRNNATDDLKWIRGVGPKNEKALHSIGVFHFDQIVAWTADNAKWAGSYMAFPGRIEREDWIGQCKLLAAGQLTEHAREVASGEADPTRHDEDHPGERPPGLASARGGRADDLKRISGIGRQNEQKLNALGIFHFDQIAAWTHEQALWAGSYMAFPGRIEREDWIGQAKLLASGQDTAFSRRVAAGDVPTSS